MTTRTSRPLEPRFSDAGFSILESHHSRDFVMRESVASFGKLLVPFDGKGFLHANGRAPVALFARRIAWIGPEVRHSLQDDTGNPLKLYIICFANRAMRGNAPGLLEPGYCVFDHPDWLADAWNRLREWRLGETINESIHEVLGLSLGYWLLARLILEMEVRGRSFPGESAGQDSRTRVQQAIEELSNTFYLNESIDQVSRRWGLSRRRFTSLVREITGNTWHELRMEYRIQHACYLLRRDPRSLPTVAFECGYSEFSTFYRNFKKLTGTSPKVFGQIKNV